MNGNANLSAEKRLPDSPRPVALASLPNRPLVSVLISNYNYGQYLGEAIASVLQQTYPDLEVIICDDGSTDASLKLLEIYEALDSRITVVRQPNGGQSLALNAAFSKSKGEIICFLDADDIFLPNKVGLVVNAFAEVSDAGFAVHKMALVDKDRKYRGGIPCLYDLPSGWYGPLLDFGGPRVLPGLPPTSGLSLRRSVAEAFFPLPAALKAYSDTLIQVVAPLVTPIAAIEVPLSEYRIHGANTGGVNRFTASRLHNIVQYEKEIWSAWHRYVSSALSLSHDFSLPTERPPSLMDYAYQRYRSGRNYKKTYEAIPPAHLLSLPRPLRLFWQASTLFPGWLFRRSFDFFYGQPPLKMMARRILNAWGIAGSAIRKDQTLGP